MELNNILWAELNYSKKYELFLTEYIAFIKGSKKYAEIATLVFSSSGLVSWISTKDTKWLAISSVVSVAAKVAELFVDKLIANDEYVQDLAEFKTEWLAHFYKVEKIFLQWHLGEAASDCVLNYYFDVIVPSRQLLEKKDAEIKIWRFPHLNWISDKRTNKSMSIYNTPNNG
jgi:hypothetical protein